MSEILAAPLAALIGSGFAITYFGGLWWTVQMLPTVRHPSAWYFRSLMLRLALHLAGILVVLVWMGWGRLAVCFAAFLMTRSMLLLWLSRDTLAARTIKEAA